MDNHVRLISNILFRRLESVDPNFDQTAYLTRFQNLQTNLARINFIYNDLRTYNLFPKFIRDGKCDVVANNHVDNANMLYITGNYRKATEDQTCGIVTGESHEILGTAYAGRSACMLKLGLYKNCVIDVDRAFSYRVNDQVKLQLYYRRLSAQLMSNLRFKYYEDIPEIPSCEFNPTIQSAKNCVQITENNTVIATRDIQIGEVISVEKPYVSLLSNTRLIHCHDCLELCFNPIPCDHCTQALFCDEICKDRAFQAYHKFECPILLTLTVLKMEAHEVLALKTAILAGQDDLNDLTTDQNETYRSDRYKEIYNLRAGIDKYPSEKLFNKTVAAAVLFHFLKNYTSYFNDASRQMMEDAIKEIIFLQLLIGPLRMVKITEFTKGILCFENEDVGLGLYPFYGLFTHSCCPNVEKHHYGSKLVLRAVNTIKKGEQCFVSYGLNYDACPRDKRRQELNNRFFYDCKCIACKENWLPNYNLTEVPFVRFEIHPSEIFNYRMKLLNGDTNAAKEILPRLIAELKKSEILEPWGGALVLKKMMSLCFASFGNKRLI